MQSDVQRVLRENASEDQMIGQANFEQKYAFDETNLIKLISQ